MFGGNDFAVRSSTYRYRDLVWTLFDDIYSPGPRSIAVFESDPANGVSWLFGGHNDQGHLSDFWQLSNGNWKLIKATGGPAACFFPVGAFDTDRGRLVVFCDDSLTYEWDGAAWKSFSGLKNNPPNRRFSEMVYDEHLHKTVLFGGYDDVNYLDATWTSVTPSNPPSPRMNGGFVFDGPSNHMLMFGGWSGLYYSQLWHLEGDSNWLLQRERFGRNRIAEPVSPPLPKGQLLAPQQ
jgi:hypothetical protein